MPAPKPVKKTTSAKDRNKAYAKVPTRTKAGDPASYTKNPHEYGDLLVKPDAKGRTKLGGALQRDIVYWIGRHTWGDSKRPEYAKLSLTQLAKLCGSDRRTIARAIADLQQATTAAPKGRGIIEVRDRSGCGPTVAKMYKLTPANWKKAPYYEPATATEDEIEPETAEEAISAPAAEASAGAETTVEPGKVSKAQPVSVSVSRDTPAVTIRMVYRSVDLPFPVRFDARPGKNGRIQISCRATAPQRFADSSPSESVVTVENTRLNEYRAFTTEFLLNFWGKSADEALLTSIISASEDAPLAVFERIVLEKFRRSRTGKHHSPGLLINLAADAARAHKAQPAKPQTPPAPTAAEIGDLERRLAEELAAPVTGRKK